MRCSREFDVGRGVRLLGVSLSQLDGAPVTQTTFDLTGDAHSDGRERTERRAAVERAVDEVRDRFGTRSVGPATLVEVDEARDANDRRGSREPR